MFITFEGGEAAGKSTQARRLADRLSQSGREVVQTREPGGTEGAEALRALLLSRQHAWSPLAEVMLHFAARADHVAGLIRPALGRGAIVVSDRFADSTMAYQGYGQGADRAAILTLGALLGLQPDLTLLLRVSARVAAARMQARMHAHPGTLDRYEAADPAFHDRVRTGFDAIAQQAPQRCVVVDGEPGADQVHRSIWAVVSSRL